MLSVKRSIPHTLTLGNLTCGVWGIIHLFDGNFAYACYLIWIAVVLDLFDGFLARALRVTSEMGKQLDSLADLVTFGVLPSLLYFRLLENKLPLSLEYLAFGVALLSALRLARFNTDDGQKTDFRGLTTTANGLLASAVPLIAAGNSFLSPFFNRPWVVLIMMLFFSALMVTPLLLFSLKFRNFNWRENSEKYLLIAAGVFGIVLWREAAIPLIIGFYLLLSIAWKFIRAKNKNSGL